MVEPWRRTAGAEPCAVKAACTVLNGGDEETAGKATRLVPTQLRRMVGAMLLLRYTVNARLLHRRQSVEERQATVSNWPMQKSIPIPSRQALFLYRVSHSGFSLLFVPILPNTPV